MVRDGSVSTMTTTQSAPALPAYYGQPINTPTGHRWAGYATPSAAARLLDTFAGVHVIDLAAVTPGVYRLTVAEGHERAAVALALQAGHDACSRTPQLVTIVTEAPGVITRDDEPAHALPRRSDLPDPRATARRQAR